MNDSTKEPSLASLLARYYPKEKSTQADFYSHALDTAFIPHLITAPEKGSKAVVIFPLLTMTYFDTPTGRSKYNCTVSDGGEIQTFNDIYESGRRNWQLGKMSGAELTTTKERLAGLPPSIAPPPTDLTDLLLISFNDGKTWQTRFYDLKHLPDSVTKVYGLYKITHGIDITKRSQKQLPVHAP